MSKGRLITFEGSEGAGKSTQVKALKKYLVSLGYKVVCTFEPGGGSDLCKKIRSLLLSPDSGDFSDETELFMMLAARAEHVESLVLPSLSRGEIVICDRFIDSSVAYQGYGRGIDIKTISQMNAFAIKGRYPDLTVVMDIDPVIGLKRAAKTGSLDRIESAALSFHQNVREGFMSLAQEGERYFVVDASLDIQTLESEIKERVLKLLKYEN
ncbi:MAG: dTMP kinase [Candidatus Cloacimonadota bacterium]|nr:MAG: dTMP kinase [Candidatus Cloacimonadota bacterium]